MLNIRNLTIISGGQTGADTGALEFALANGISHGGLCPKGRKCEDGVIPARFNLLVEAKSSDYAHRTRRNVALADATVIFRDGKSNSRGSALTLKIALAIGKPVHTVYTPSHPLRSAEYMLEFLKSVPGLRKLNIAGQRESSSPGISVYTQQVLQQVLRLADQERSSGQ